MTNKVICTLNRIKKRQKQEKEYWCFAAVMSMYLERYNIFLEQKDVVSSIHGSIDDRGATVEDILFFLKEKLGKEYTYYPV